MVSHYTLSQVGFTVLKEGLTSVDNKVISQETSLLYIYEYRRQYNKSTPLHTKLWPTATQATEENRTEEGR